MASPETVKPRPLASLDAGDSDIAAGQLGRLGIIQGFLIGLALVVGVWGGPVYALRPLPLVQKYHSFILAAALIIGLTTLVGWLTARLGKTAVTVLLWLLTAVATTFIISTQPYQLRSLVAWLADTRFWGLPIYPFLDSFSLLLFLSIITAGFFMILLFTLLALFQETRLENIHQERGENGRLTPRAWVSLLLPLPLVILVGMITANIMGNTAWRAFPIADQVIRTARAYDGDLFALGLAEGINYAAANGVVEQLAGPYQLSLGSVDPMSLTTIVVAHFDSGAWINCRFLNDQINFCYDASRPYTNGLHSLLTGQPVPETCRDCLPVVTAEWRDWLQEQGATLGGEPVISRQAQQGDYVLMAATTAVSDTVIECWFQGSSPVTLTHCQLR